MKKITIVILFAMVAFGCSKYPDGPILSFRAKAKRLAHTWKYETIIYTSQNITVNTGLPDYKMTFTEDGDYSSNYNETGKWEFGDGIDLNITINRTSGDTLISYEIYRLSSKELWLKTGDEERHFVSE